MDPLLAASELCAARGFLAPASSLLAASARGFVGYLLLEHVPVRWQGIDGTKRLLSADGAPRSLFLDLDAARARALEGNAARLRDHNILNYLLATHDIPWVFEPRDFASFEARVGEILGVPFRVRCDSDSLREVHDLPPMFPAWATDEQMLRIARLFRDPFFYVEPIELPARASPGPMPAPSPGPGLLGDRP